MRFRAALFLLLSAAVGCGKTETINWDSTPPPSRWVTSSGGGQSLQPMQVNHSLAAVTQFQGVIYVVGGGTAPCTGSTSQGVEWYDTTGNGGGNINLPALGSRTRAAGGVACFSGAPTPSSNPHQCFFFGGCDPTGVASPETDSVDPDIAGQWAGTPASMGTARYGFAYAVVNGRVYVAGGASNTAGPTQDLSAAEVFDPTTTSWTSIAPLPGPRRSFAAGASLGGLFYVLGGESNGSVAYTRVDVFNPATNTWNGPELGTLPPPMPTAQAGGAGVVGGRIYVVGGGTTASTLVQVYDPNGGAPGSGGSWSNTPITQIPTGRTWTQPVGISPGLYVAAGGSTDFDAWFPDDFNLNNCGQGWQGEGTTGPGGPCGGGGGGCGKCRVDGPADISLPGMLLGALALALVYRRRYC